jgi:phosphate transport system substrate-binding protein
MNIGKIMKAIVPAALAVTVAAAWAQDPAPVEDGLALQRARAVSVTSKGKRVWYTEKFDLSELPAYVPERKVKGKLRIWGNNYIGDGMLADFWKEGFRKYHPEVEFDYVLPTHLVAVPGLYTGVADIGMSRKITFYEQLGFERLLGYEPLEITALTGSYNVSGWLNAITIFVHQDNPLAKLTMEQLDGIFGAQRDGGWIGTSWHPEFARGPEKNIRTWGQLGLTGEWADKPIDVYGYSLRYNMSYQFSDAVLKGGDKWNERVTTFANKSKPDGTIYLQANQMEDALKNDKYGIGYLGYNGDKPGIKHLAIATDARGPYVPVSMKTVQNRTYPLFCELYWYVNQKPGEAMDPKVSEFLRYALSREGQNEVQRDGKYLPLTAEVARAQLVKLTGIRP